MQEQIIVDQFGWRPQSIKVALFADPVSGQNATGHYHPGTKFQLRREEDDAIVYEGRLQSWHEGQVDTSSGDKVWWGDFTEFEHPGTYYIFDPENDVRSYPFDIREDVYNDVLKAAVRAFYYQRCGVAIPSQYGDKWTHPPCHIHRQQDTQALRYTTSQHPKNVQGGWHDAGDFNKYVSFTAKTLWNLIDAFENNPEVFGDNFHIPESGNGVPDLLDEIKWELDWILRMQLADGSVANRVASHECDLSLPHQDKGQRLYTEPTTWATASLVIDTANAARVFRQYQNVYPGYAEKLLDAAEKAWFYLEQTPERFPEDGHDYGSKGFLGCASQADEAGEDSTLRLWAAAELYRATDRTAFRNYFDQHYRSLKDGWFDPMGGKDHLWSQQLAYVTYARTPGADPAKVDEIKQALRTTTNWFNNLDIRQEDPYRALIWDYFWGSNQVKADWGLTFQLARTLKVETPREQLYAQNSEEYLHYLHGRNPLAWVYLSNMGTHGAATGAEKSVSEIYHSWFHDGSLYDLKVAEHGPAPGFLTGGPNRYYAVQQVAPPYGEPSQKAYKDWNGNWNSWGNFSEKSWEITEPAIYYQAAYVDLLSYFCITENGT